MLRIPKGISEVAAKAVKGFGDYIASEVLADSIVMGGNDGAELELVEGVVVRILVERV